MFSLQKIGGLVAIALLSGHPVAATEEIVFCKLLYIPIPGTPEDIAHCIGQNNYNLAGCYRIPGGYGLKGQSFNVTQGTAKCALFHDTGCSDPKPDRAWYGSHAQNIGQDFYSFICNATITR